MARNQGDALVKPALILVGVGPGDPELLTLKAVRVLGEADVVAFPQKSGEESMALGIARGHLGPDAILLPAQIPMTVERGPAQLAYDALANEIRQHLGANRSVAYLCEGDPLFYGSAMYLIDRLSDDAEVSVVPGVTSLTASAASIVRPLAARNETLKILPAPLPDDRLRAELAATDAAAIIKVGRHFNRVRAILGETGHLEGAVVVEHATTPAQRITPLAAFAHDERPYFSTILCYRGSEAWGE